MPRLLILFTIAAVLAALYWSIEPFLRPLIFKTPAEAAKLELASGCDLTATECRIRVEGAQLWLRFEGPIKPMQPFEVRLSGAQTNSATIEFSMEGMDMGLNRYRLRSLDEVTRAATVVLPVCTSARRDWLAQVNVVLEDKTYAGVFPFVMQ